jgi:hypothetical protein
MSVRWPANTTPSAAPARRAPGDGVGLVGIGGPMTTIRTAAPRSCRRWRPRGARRCPSRARAGRPPRTPPRRRSDPPLGRAAAGASGTSRRAGSGSKWSRSMPLPSRRTLRAGTRSVRTSVSTSSGFCTSSACAERRGHPLGRVHRPAALPPVGGLGVQPVLGVHHQRHPGQPPGDPPEDAGLGVVGVQDVGRTAAAAARAARTPARPEAGWSTG